MFKITPNPTFKAAVEIPVPGGEPQKLPMVFKHKGKKEVAEFNDAMLKAGNEQDKAKGLQAEADPLYDQAVEIVLKNRRASISLVQRHLKIGYNRAARILEQMENAGIVSPMSSNGNRDILVPTGEE